jgi:colanic acid biosynthesis glycosyl transferase WcaI
MKIVFANCYVFPDQSVTSRKGSGLAFPLARRGFEVTAIASRTLHDHSNAAQPAREMVAGLNIKRLWAMRFGRKNIFGIAIDYLIFHISAFLWCLWNLRSGDIYVVCTDPPLLSVTTALPICWRRERMVNWFMDLFPEVVIIPLCNGEAIADLAEKAIERAADFIVKRYGKRLLAPLSVLPGQRHSSTECVA